MFTLSISSDKGKPSTNVKESNTYKGLMCNIKRLGRQVVMYLVTKFTMKLSQDKNPFQWWQRQQRGQ